MTASSAYMRARKASNIERGRCANDTTRSSHGPPVGSVLCDACYSAHLAASRRRYKRTKSALKFRIQDLVGARIVRGVAAEALVALAHAAVTLEGANRESELAKRIARERFEDALDRFEP